MKDKKISRAIFILSAMLLTLTFTNTIPAATFFQTDYAYGVQHADDPTLGNKYTSWYGWFVTSSGAGGYLRTRYPEGVAGYPDATASEGIGYGMLIAVWAGEQTTFNSLWNYKVLHSVSKGLMSWLVDAGGTNRDTNSATDADEDVAMALILAHRRWGSGGAVNYSSLATTEVGKVQSQDICASDYRIYPGDYCSCTSNDNTYPSYFTPAWYTEFGAFTGNVTFWNNVKTWAFTALDSCRNDTTGLAGEHCTWNGGSTGENDGYNSSRIPWRYSLDYIWNNDANAINQISKSAVFYNTKATTACAVYTTAGGCADATVNGQRVGPAGTSMMYTAAPAGQLDAYFTAMSGHCADNTHFYNASLAFLSLMQITGNCPKIFGTPQPTPTTPPGDLFDDCEDGDNVNNWGGYWYAYSDVGPNKGTSYMVPWPDMYAATWNKTPQPFTMTGPGLATGSMNYAVRMTGIVTTAYTYGFCGIGSGTNPDSGSPTFAVTDLTMYTGIRFYVKGSNATEQFHVKIKCPSSVTSTGDNEYKYTFMNATAATLVTVPFASFTQETGWGIPVSMPLVLANATDVQIQTKAQPIALFDVSLDDIMFYPAKTATQVPTYCDGEYLDNMEDNNNENIFGGYWSTYADTDGSVVWPSSVTIFAMSAPGANLTNYCARITGHVTNVTYSFIGMATNVQPVTTTGRNLSMFNAVAFYVKGDGNMYSVKLKASSVTNTADNDYKFTFKPSSTNWEQWVIPFAVMTQERGWGIPVSKTYVLQNLVTVQFESKGINHDVDLSIDDVEFRCSLGWTPTPTKTEMVSESATNTPTPTPSRTASPTRTNTPLPTNTRTPSATRTGTPTRTPTGTPSDTRTRTFTPTESPVYTATETGTGTPPTETFTPTITRTNTELPTATDTPIDTPVNTATNTPIDTPVNTPVDTAIDTPVDTAVPTLTNTPILPTATPTNTQDTSLPVDVLIDDCDDGNNANLLGGYWYTFCDAANAGDSYVVPIADTWADAMVPPWAHEAFTMNGYDHNTNAAGKAARMTGTTSNLLGWDFIGMGTNLFDPKAPHDISCCSGIRFYARSTTGSMTSFRVKVGHPTAFTPTNDGGDMYGRLFTVNGTWQLIDVPYANLTQEGWGTVLVKTAALSVAESIQFQSTAAGVTLIDLEVDDLTLYSCLGGCMPTPVPTTYIPPTPTITPTPNVPLVSYLIDNCDDNDNANNLGGYWYTFDDQNNGGQSYVWPMSDQWGVAHAVPTYAFIMSNPGNGGVGYAASMTGTTANILGYDFIGMGTNLSDPISPKELNCCGGIRFYAKSNNPAAMSSFRVKLGHPDAFSPPDVGGNMYGRAFTVTGSWQMYEFQFTDFTQETGWGTTIDRAAALAETQSIQFQSTSPDVANINLWVDDLSLVNCYPGCVTLIGQSPTNTPVPSYTNTPVPTITNSPVPSMTDTPGNTPVVTATESPVDTLVPTNTASPLPTATVTQTISLGTPVSVLIDDCDDGNNANLLGGYWYTFCDAGNSGDSYVNPIADTWADAMVPPWPHEEFTMNGFDHNTNAASGSARMTGTTSNLLGWDFIGMGVNLFDPKAPHDISCCTGIRFYARTTSGTMANFRVKVGHPTAFTPTNDGGDMYGRVFTVNSTWQLIDVPYANLTQEGWGTVLNRTAALSVGESIQFQSTSAGVALIDLEVDDLTLYDCYGGCMPTPVDTVLPSTPTMTPSRTPTPAPTTTTLQFTEVDPVLAFPNPAMIDENGDVVTRPVIEYGITRGVTRVIFKMFTPAGRLIRQVVDATDHLAAGRYTVSSLTDADFEGLAQGIYYYVIIAEDQNANISVKSKTGKLLIFKR